MIPGFFQGTEMPTEGWWGTLWPDPARVLTSLGLKPGMRVVDLCCGDGWSCSPFRFPSHASPPPRPRSARARRGRRSLRRVGNLRSDRGAMQYYNGARTHLALNKDAPVPRAVQVVGRILSTPILGGLHHQYVRIAKSASPDFSFCLQISARKAGRSQSWESLVRKHWRR